MRQALKARVFLGLLILTQLTFAHLATRALSSEAASEVSDTWKSHRDSVRRHPSILRYYSFETLSPENPVVPSLAGESESLTYVAGEPLTVVEGRWPAKRAARLDRGFFQAKSFAVDDGAFTVEIRFRKHGQGTLLGNGRTNGMLLAQGDGYWNGLRVWTDYPAKRLVFEIGRPKPNSSFSLSTSEPAPDGVWHHLAAVWDGRQMRLYLNGLLLRAAAYSGHYTPAESPLRVGFANAGIGSLKMDVDEVAVYGSALSPVEILRHANPVVPLPQQAEAKFLEGTSAAAREDWAAAGAAFAAIVEMNDVPPVHAASARMALGHSLARQGKTIDAVAQYTAVFENADAPEQLRQAAVRMCLVSERGVIRAIASKGVYRCLLESAELSERERFDATLCLAECDLRDGDSAAAGKVFEAALRMPGVTEPEAWNVRLQIAHAYLAAKDYQAARAEYARLAAASGVPPEFRGNALLCIAHSHARQKAYKPAAEAFAEVLNDRSLLAHHRKEAQERIHEMDRLHEGLPARDPADSRVKLVPSPQPALSFYVSPNGDDGNPGTKDRPFGSLTRARDAVGAIKSRDGLPPGGVAVVVRGGLYPLRQTFTLTETDSGTPEAPIVYRAFPGENPRFSGGLKIGGFQPVTDKQVLGRLPQEAQGKVLQADLKANGVTDFGQLGVRGYGRAGYPTHPWVDLYVDGKPMQLARWPNEGFVEVGEVHDGRFQSDQAQRPGRFQYQGDRPSRWGQANDAWMFGYWGHLWAGVGVKVGRIDTQLQQITTVQRASYGYRQGQPYYYFNLLEELDRPGEWYLDRQSGLVYLIPPDNLEDFRTAQIEFPILSTPFVVMENVSHVSIQRLTFELGRAEGAVITNGTDNLLAGCTFCQLGSNGVIISGGNRHGVLGCDIHTLGAGGLRVSGGDRGTLTPGNHFVENCHVHHFSRVDRVYAPAVHLDGVGNRIAHNLFNDSPHHGMRVEGYEHLIEFNEIHSVVYEADDQAGIDMFGNPAYRGNVIRHNFWHHIGSGHNVAGQAGIRLDDFISAVLVYGNVFYRCAGGRFGGVQIHGGKDNIVDNNLFIDCKYALSFSPWGESRWLERLGRESTRGAIARGGVDVAKPPHATRYPDLAQMADNPDRNFIWRNLAVDCGRFSVRDPGKNEMADNHALSGDPGFADPENLDFSVTEDSPIFDRFGFRLIPFHEIGLYEDKHRATWPVENQVTPRYFQEN